MIGAFITYTVIKSFDALGPAKSALLIVVAQILVAYLIEVFGWFGVEKAGFEWRKAIGAAVAIAGIVISDGNKNFCLCLKGVLVRIELRTKRASEKEGCRR